MNEKSNIRMEQSLDIVYDKINIQQTKSKSIAATNIRFMSLVQELRDVRRELKQVTMERDRLKREVLNCFRII